MLGQSPPCVLSVSYSWWQLCGCPEVLWSHIPLGNCAALGACPLPPLTQLFPGAIGLFLVLLLWNASSPRRAEPLIMRAGGGLRGMAGGQWRGPRLWCGSWMWLQPIAGVRVQVGASPSHLGCMGHRAEQASGMWGCGHHPDFCLGKSGPRQMQEEMQGCCRSRLSCGGRAPPGGGRILRVGIGGAPGQG